MTTYTNTKVGQVTEVRTGLFTATIDVDTNGELPTVTVAGEQLDDRSAMIDWAAGLEAVLNQGSNGHRKNFGSVSQ